MMDPEQSWVARWQRTGERGFSDTSRQQIADSAHSPPSGPASGLSEKFVRGVYAVRVTGRLPIEVQEALHSKGFRYRARDQIQEL